MALYVEDAETSELLSRYAKLKGTTKTGALRDLLKRELDSLERKAVAEERFRRIMKWLAPVPSVEPEPIPKSYYDWLAGDKAEMPDLSARLKKELGLKHR